MIHVVCPVEPRSFSSLLMHMLRVSGHPVVWSETRNIWAERKSSNYQINPNLYELTAAQQNAPGFPAMYDGRGIKLIGWGVLHMAPGEYDVCVLTRDPEALQASFREALQAPRHTVDPERYWDKASRIVTLLKMRGDCRVTVLDGPRLVTDTDKAIVELAWPIDPMRAREAVDPALYRFRT